jgi:hypothetical protein
MQQALYYMDDGCGKYSDDYRKLIEALRARLAQPEQEPVAWVDKAGAVIPHSHKLFKPELFVDYATPLYTVPPQREWVGLTPEEAREISLANRPYVVDMIAALEARLKEKNT